MSGMSRPLTALLLCALAALAGGCDQLGIESVASQAARREADGKAVGGACRHAGRAIEDCYALNRKVDRAAIYEGWRDMNEYMLEHKLEPVPPQSMAEPQVAANPAEDPSDEVGPKSAGVKPSKKGKSDAS